MITGAELIGLDKLANKTMGKHNLISNFFINCSLILEKKRGLKKALFVSILLKN
jgi:hypothetical protein